MQKQTVDTENIHKRGVFVLGPNYKPYVLQGIRCENEIPNGANCVKFGDLPPATSLQAKYTFENSTNGGCGLRRKLA